MAEQKAKIPMVLKLTKTSDEINKFIKGLLMGPTGSGKTTSIKGFGDFKGLDPASTLIIVSERGARPLYDTSYDMIKVNSWEEVDSLLEAIIKKNKAVLEQIGLDLSKYSCIVIDSLTDISDMLKTYILEKARPELMLERTNNRSRKPEKMYEDAMSQEDYGVYKTLLQNLVRNVNAIEKNVIWMALSATRQKFGEDIVVPDISGQFAFQVGRYFDYVFLIEDRTAKDGAVRRGWKTRQDSTTLCKDSTGELAGFIPPDWNAILNKTQPQPKPATPQPKPDTKGVKQ